MKKTKIKFYLLIDLLIMVVGLSLCALSIFGLYHNVAFELLLFVSTLGAIMTMLGSSLFVDMLKFRSTLRKSGMELQF